MYRQMNPDSSNDRYLEVSASNPGSASNFSLEIYNCLGTNYKFVFTYLFSKDVS